MRLLEKLDLTGMPKVFSPCRALKQKPISACVTRAKWTRACGNVAPKAPVTTT